MPDIAIRAERLGKKYRIARRQERYRTLRDALAEAGLGLLPMIRSIAHRNGNSGSRAKEEIWALQDVAFEIPCGEVVGVIGRNGAGKTTLLKVLSRITEPSAGYAEVNGRVGSLLEVGTGFHLELTGRENICLNGAILGMRRNEIDRKFDEIVAFAEVERFIDTPVKHYSTGMYLRLAFAVAAYLEPEILLVDEVLAVGDATFQKKCLGKMGEVARQGRTVLFVSHNMAAVRSLCRRGMVLDQGRLCFDGPIELALYRYQESLRVSTNHRGRNEVEFSSVAINGGRGSLQCGAPLEVSCAVGVRKEFPAFELFCMVQNENGELMAIAATDHKEACAFRKAGSYDVRVRFPNLWLRPGVYSLHWKFLANDLDVGKRRFLSDHVMLDVCGDVPPATLAAYLTPAVEWDIQG